MNAIADPDLWIVPLGFLSSFLFGYFLGVESARKATRPPTGEEPTKGG